MEIVAASTPRGAVPLTLDAFEFPLPPELIAQVPAERRDMARLLAVDRRTTSLTHTHVSALPELLQPDDLLVVNDTKVIPARIFGRGASGGAVELLLIRPVGDAGNATKSLDTAPEKMGPTRDERSNPPHMDHQPFAPRTEIARREYIGPTDPTGWKPVPPVAPASSRCVDSSRPLSAAYRGVGQTWLCLGKPAKRLRAGTTLTLAGGSRATVSDGYGDGRYRVTFDSGTDVRTLLDQQGEIPLPPYIHRPDGPLPLDRDRYQTIFATSPGAIAAPTAGLHFTNALLEALRARGIGSVSLTLHVGPGTFQPVRVADIHRHVMDPEWCEIPESTAAAIRAAKAAGRRVVAVGTTTTRALESAASADGSVAAGARWADCFIVPGHRFRVVDALFTNFHLPGSTLLLLVSAFAGHQSMRDAYAEAIHRRYRFYSYGDAMLIQ